MYLNLGYITYQLAQEKLQWTQLILCQFLKSACKAEIIYVQTYPLSTVSLEGILLETDSSTNTASRSFGTDPHVSVGSR